MSFHRSRDANEREIVDALKGHGATVTRIESMSLKDETGCPDLLVGWRGITFLMEVKNPDRAKRSQAAIASGTDNRLTPPQKAWHGAWLGGPVVIVDNAQEAIAALGIEPPDWIKLRIDETDGKYVYVKNDTGGMALEPHEADGLAGALHELAGHARAKRKEVAGGR